jgi:hypothetical protein
MISFQNKIICASTGKILVNGFDDEWRERDWKIDRKRV